jgi:hypothetical protein
MSYGIRFWTTAVTLGWSLRYPSWRQGFVEVFASTRPTARSPTVSAGTRGWRDSLLALFHWQFPAIDIRRAGEEISAANATGEAAMRRAQLRGPGGVPTLARSSAWLKHSLARGPPWTRRRQIPRSLGQGCCPVQWHALEDR